MLKRRSKHFALLLVLTMLATMFVGVGTASAAASYSATSIQKVSAAANQNLGEIRISIPAVELKDGTTGDFFILRLPSDFNFGLPVGNGYTLTQVGASDIFNVIATNLQIRIPQIDNALALANSANITVDVIAENELRVKVNNDAGPALVGFANAYFYIMMNAVTVDSSSPATILATIEGRPGSPFVNAEVPVASFGTGITELSIDSIKTVTTSTDLIDKMRLKEDRPGAFATGQTVKIKLPSGYKWSIVAVAPSPAATITVFDGEVGLTTPTFDASVDNGRSLVLTSTYTSSTRASYFMLNDFKVVVDDETVAKTGEISATLGGTANSTPSDFVVAKYGDYSVKVEAFGDPETVTAGRTGQEIGKFVIEEGIAGSLSVNKTITATLVGGAKWDAFPRQDVSNSKNWGAPINAGWVAVGSGGDTIRLTLGAAASASAIKAVFEKAEIHVAPNAAEEIKVAFSGSAGISGEVLVANVAKPVTASIEGTAADIIIGAQATQLPDIFVKENKKEAIDASTATQIAAGVLYDAAAGTYYKDLNGVAGFQVGVDLPISDNEAKATVNKNKLVLEFPMDVLPSLPSKIEVVEGDIVLDQSSIMRNVTADGRWYIQVTVKSTSAKPATIKFSGIKINVSRTVPEGPMLVAVKGDALVQTAAYFPGQTAVATATVGKVVTPAAADVMNETTFVIGAANYNLNGVEQAMDVAPYIKDSRTYMPIRYVGYALGINDANILWDGAKQTVTLMKGDKVVQLQVGSTALLINGASVTMDVAPEITSDRTMLPISFVANAFGATASWDAATQTVTIK